MKRKHDAEVRQSDYWYERSLEKVDKSNKAEQHHQARDVIVALSLQAQNALERYTSAHTNALLSQVQLLKISVAKHEARVLVREAKLRSLRRRLRRKRLWGLARWSKR